MCIFLDFNAVAYILCRLPISRGSREVYLLIFFLYEKSILRASILEESLNLYSDIPETKANREAISSHDKEKSPLAWGFFNGDLCPIVLREQIQYILFSRKSKDFCETPFFHHKIMLEGDVRVLKQVYYLSHQLYHPKVLGL